MTLAELEKVFEKYDGEFLHFEHVENRLSNRPDLHAFLLIDKLVPGTGDIVTSAEHDEIWLDVPLYLLAEVITEMQVRELVGCGVRYDSDLESLALFV